MIYASLVMLLLLLLGHFGRVQLCDPTDGSPPGSPVPGILQARHWSGLPFPSPVHESEAAQSCPTLCNPMDRSLPGFSVHGIFQTRVLEWAAIAFPESLCCTLNVNRAACQLYLNTLEGKMESQCSLPHRIIIRIKIKAVHRDSSKHSFWPIVSTQ